MPELIAAQYQYVSSAIREVHPEAFARFVNDTNAVNQQVLANYLFGLQLVGVVFAAMLPLTLARAVQSQLYYPGGFNQEMFAADEIDLSQLLKKWGQKRGLKFTILTRHPLVTSPRKVQLYTGQEIASQILSVLFSPRKALQDKKKLPILYDGRR